MLSLMTNIRVFESSDDIKLYSTSNYHQKSNLNNAIQRKKRIKNAKHEELNLHHSYLINQENNEFNHIERVKDAYSIDPELMGRNKRDRRRMNLVFLSSGEIRTRKDGELSLKRGYFQQKRDDEEEENEERDRRQASDERRRELVEKTVRERRQEADGDHKKAFNTSLSSFSEDGDELSDDSGESDSEESDKEEEDTRQAVQNAEEEVVKGERDGGKRKTPSCLLTLDYLGRERGGGTLGEVIERTYIGRDTTGLCNKEVVSGGDTSYELKRRPVPLEQVLRLDGLKDVPICRSKRSSKMEVGHLASDEPISSPKIRTSTRRENSMVEVDRLEKELQKEKRRVLEKTTRLLDEQGKNQQLCGRVGELETQLAVKDSETSSKIRRAAREQEKQRRSSEKKQDDRVNELEEHARLQKADIARLKHDKTQLETALEQLKKTGSELSSNQHYDTMEVAGLRAELDDMNRRLYDFLAKVECWKSNSKEKMQNYDDKKTDLPVFLENMWLDFPQFAGIAPRPDSGRPNRSSKSQQQSTIDVDEQANVILFLKKRLREREDKLRETHIKYMELKEMCARQCVREADLQNFINEHRLRGNLVIRKNSSSKSKGADSNQEQTQKDPHDEHRRNATLRMTSSGDTNTPASYNERGRVQKDVVDEECSDNHEDNDDCEDGDKYDNPLRSSKVFVQVGRDGVYEQASTTNSAVAQKLATDRSREKRRLQPKQQQQEQQVERIRCRPSSSLAQRYEQVPHGKKLAQQPFLQPACPPRCGSRPSFMRRKAPTTAARAKKPAITGVIRPWI